MKTANDTVSSPGQVCTIKDARLANGVLVALTTERCDAPLPPAKLQMHLTRYGTPGCGELRTADR